MAIFNKFYSKQSLWALFLMCALPIHIWTIILALRDFDWISKRTNSWDAIGTASYGLVFAFIESIVLFLFVVALGFLISNQWREKKRVTVMSSMVVIFSLWAIFNQIYFLQETQLSEEFINFFVNLQRPLLILYGMAFFFIFASFLIPIFFILHSNKFEFLIQKSIERLSLLMMVYLIFDIFALVIVLIRNI